MPFNWTGPFGSNSHVPSPGPVLGKRKVPHETTPQVGRARNDLPWNGFQRTPPDVSSDEEDRRPLKRPTAGRALGSNPKPQTASTRSKHDIHQLDNGRARSSNVYSLLNGCSTSKTASMPRTPDSHPPQSSPKPPSRLQQYLDNREAGRDEHTSNGLNYDRESTEMHRSQGRLLETSGMPRGRATTFKPSLSRPSLAATERAGAYAGGLKDPPKNIFGDVKPFLEKHIPSIPSRSTPHSKHKAAARDGLKTSTAPVPAGQRNQSITVISDTEDDADNNLHTIMRRKHHPAPTATSRAEAAPGKETPIASKSDSDSCYPDGTTRQSGPETQPLGTRASAPEDSRSDFEKEMEGLTRIKDRLAALKKQKEERAKAAEEEARRQKAKRQEIQRQEVQRREAQRHLAQLQEAERREAEHSRKAAEAATATKPISEHPARTSNPRIAADNASQVPVLTAKTGQASAPPTSSGPSQAEERLKVYNVQKAHFSQCGTMSSSAAAALIQASTSGKRRDPRNQEAPDRLRHQGLPEDISQADAERKKPSQSIHLYPKKREENVTDNDWLIFDLRNRGWSYPNIVSHWPRFSDSRLSSADQARKKYTAMKATYPDLVPSNAPCEQRDRLSDLSRRQRNAAIAERRRNNQSFDDLTAPETSNDERAKNRREALAGAPPEEDPVKIEHRTKSGRQDGRPTTSGKQISEDLYHYIMETLPKTDGEHEDSLDSQPARALSPPQQDDKIHFVYRVFRRTVWPTQKEEAARWIQCMTDYDELHQANKAAIAETGIERNNLGIADMPNISTQYDEATGMVSLRASSKEGMTDVKVDRFERTLDDGREPSTKRGWIRREVYDVIEHRTLIYTHEEEYVEEHGSVSETTASSCINDQLSNDHNQSSALSEHSSETDTVVPSQEMPDDDMKRDISAPLHDPVLPCNNQPKQDDNSGQQHLASGVDAKSGSESGSSASAEEEIAVAVNACEDDNTRLRSRSSTLADSVFDSREGEASTAATSFDCLSDVIGDDSKAGTMASAEEHQAADDDWTKQLDSGDCSGAASKVDTSKPQTRQESLEAPGVSLRPQTIVRTKKVVERYKETSDFVDSVFGSKSRANRRAAAHYLELAQNLDPVPEEKKRRMDYAEKLREAKVAMDERLEELEDEKPGYFKDVIYHDLSNMDEPVEVEGLDDIKNDGTKWKLMSVRVEVETIPRGFQNPRNIFY